MAMKSVLLLITLLVVVFVAPKANAIAVEIGGTALCPLNGTINLNITTNVTVPPLPIANATVRVSIAGIEIGPTGLTDSLGQFSVSFIRSVITALSNLLNLTTITITPPPGACNSTLPVNTILQSVQPLQLVRQTNVSIQLNVTGLRLAKLNNV
uniref:uncharacterized protein LOC122598138 n=1 Tax=Erigeron canadensis TaxID=72917 RepID=UPI001CB8D28A|nr:uncharacterized protein LOC122598138 [Erigeron canadensis]